jgi:Flp pilus assembly protein TadD
MERPLLFCLFGLFFASTLFAQPGGGPKAYAVVIGISQYQDEDIPSLSFADRDAEAFRAFLQSPSGGKLGEEQIQYLINEKADYASILGALDWLYEKAAAGNRAYFFFSGHGDVETSYRGQKGYLLAYDTRSQDYRLGGLRVDELGAALEGIVNEKQAKAILIADACRSGELAGKQVGAQAANQSLAQSVSGEVRILSCMANQLSVEDKTLESGVFSYHLIEGLKGKANTNDDPEILLFELEQYLKSQVAQKTNFAQIPVVFSTDPTLRMAVIHPDSMDQMLAQAEEEPASELLANAKGGRMDWSALDTSIRRNYRSFENALAKGAFLKGEAPRGQSAEEYYNYLMSRAELVGQKEQLTREFAIALQAKVQEALNAYVEANSKELARRWNYSSEYDNYPLYLRKAVDILGANYWQRDYLRAKQFYFEAVVLRLKAERRNKDKRLLEQALEKVKAAEKLEKQGAFIYNEMGLIYRQLGDFEEAEKNFLQASRISPNWALPKSNLCWIYTDMGRLEEAEKSGREAVAIDSSFYNSFITLGDLFHYFISEKKKAEQMYDRAIELMPDDPFAYFKKGWLMLETGRKNEAEPLFLKAIQLNPKEPRYYNGAGYCYYEKKQLKSSEYYLQKAIDLDPNYLNAHYNLASTYFYLGNYSGAKYHLFKVLQIDRSYYWADYALACVYQKQGQTQKALEFLESSLGKGLDDVSELRDGKEIAELREMPEFHQLIRKYLGRGLNDDE